MKRTVGIVLGFSLLFTLFATPAAVKGEALPPMGEEEEIAPEHAGLVEQAVASLLSVPPQMKRSDFPYAQLYSCLNFVIPPFEPVLVTALPILLVRVIKLLNALLALSPVALSRLLSTALPLIVSEPYSVIVVIELILNPFSLSLCNPLTWPTNAVCKSVCEGLEMRDVCLNPSGFIQTCLGNVANVCNTWLVGLAGVLNLVQPLLGMAEREFT